MPLVLLLCEILFSYIFIFSLFYKKHQEKKYNTTLFKMFEAFLRLTFAFYAWKYPGEDILQQQHLYMYKTQSTGKRIW